MRFRRLFGFGTGISDLSFSFSILMVPVTTYWSILYLFIIMFLWIVQVLPISNVTKIVVKRKQAIFINIHQLFESDKNL